MIEEQRFEGNRIRARYYGIPTNLLRAMTPDELIAELQRVERHLRLWRQSVQGKPPWFRVAVQRQRNCLASEKRRIERELKERGNALTKDQGPPLVVTSVIGTAV